MGNHYKRRNSRRAQQSATYVAFTSKLTAEIARAYLYLLLLQPNLLPVRRFWATRDWIESVRPPRSDAIAENCATRKYGFARMQWRKSAGVARCEFSKLTEFQSSLLKKAKVTGFWWRKKTENMPNNLPYALFLLSGYFSTCIPVFSMSRSACFGIFQRNYPFGSVRSTVKKLLSLCARSLESG